MFALTLDIKDALDNLGNPFQITDLGGFISSAIGVGVTLAAVAALLYLLWGGFEWITSGGDKGSIENARNKITAAIFGLAIVAALWAIFGLVQYFLGVNLITSNGGGGGGGGSGGGTVEHGFRCPGPNCDRCPNGTRAIPINDPQWEINSGC